MNLQNRPLLRFVSAPPVLIVLVVLAVHSRVVWFPFVRDDVWQIERLPAHFDAELITRAWTTDHWGGHGAGLYRPVLHSLWIMEAVVAGGHREFVVRQINLMLLVANALVFRAFLRRMGIGPPLALLGALVPVVHVTSVEIVDQGVGQGELIAVLLTLICLHLTESMRSGGGAWWRGALIVALMLCGMLVKETMFPALFVCPALLLAGQPSAKRRAVGLSIGLAAVFAVTMSARLLILRGSIGPTPDEQMLSTLAPLERVTTALALTARYALSAVVPMRPEVDYQYLESQFPPSPLWWIAGLVIVVVTVAIACALMSRHRKAPIALLWVALTLGLVVHIIPVGTVYGMRLLWPAMFPMAWAGAWVIEHLGQRRWMLALAGLWLVANAALAYLHVSEHRNGTTLWSAAVARHPENPVAQQSLAVHLIIDASKSEVPEPLRAEARAHLETALAMNSESPRTWATLGRLELDERRLEAAEGCFGRALDLDPDDTAALFDMGVLHTTRSEWAEARECWERVVAIEPLYPNAQLFLSRLPE